MADTASPAPPSTVRYHGLDAARAAAMLLGVVYHLPITMLAGGFGFGMGGPRAPKAWVDEWLHSFRMPMFFMISGFFALLMLSRYGLTKFMLRRWWRIGGALFVSLGLLLAWRLAVEKFDWQPNLFGAAARPSASPFGGPGFGGPGFGGGGFGGPGFGPPPGGMNGFGGPGFGGPGFGGPGFGPPPGSFGGPGFGGPGFGPPPAESGSSDGEGDGDGEGDRDSDAGERLRREASAQAAASAPRSYDGSPGAGAPPFGLAPGAQPAFPPPFPVPAAASNPWSRQLFGELSRHLRLEHLWFLWYLLVMVTVLPLALQAIALPLRPILGSAARGVRIAMRWNVAAPILALLTLPALIHARSPTGWALANPQGFLGTFPDFLGQYVSDWPFYALYFIAGWILFSCREELGSLTAHWKWSLAIGVFSFWISRSLADSYASRPEVDNFERIRLASFALYGVGTAYSSLGFLGFFQRFLDRPTPTVRYLADTALWIYLIHLPLIPYVISWVEVAKAPWWVATCGGMALVTGISLALYELVVRPTPLIYLYGPASPRRAAQRPEAPKELPEG